MLDDVVFRATSSAGGIGTVAVSEGTGDAKEPDIEVKRKAGENP